MIEHEDYVREVAPEDRARPHLVYQDRLRKQDLIAVWDRIRNKGKVQASADFNVVNNKYILP